MQALRKDHDAAAALVIQAGELGGAHPVVRSPALTVRHGFGCTHRIIDDNGLTASAGKRAANRDHEAKATAGCVELSLGVLRATDPRGWKDLAINGRTHERARVIRVLYRQCL